jgi:ribonuclease VapC
MAVVLREESAGRIEELLGKGESIAISAATAMEALVVSRRRGVGAQMAELLAGLGARFVPVTWEFSQRAAAAYDRWGRGVSPAGLNLLDCFAYALAEELACPLLYVGDDFAKTDIQSALNPAP